MKTHFLFLLLLLFTQALSAQQSNLAEGESYAWASNFGWIDLKPHRPTNNDGVRINATCLEGHAWSDATGWLFFGDGTPANGTSYANIDGSDAGVNRDSQGNLTGLAWSANVGWISFSWAAVDDPNRPRIHIYSGQFSGLAWAAGGSWVNLGTSLLRTSNVAAAEAELASLTSSVGTPVVTSSGYSIDVPDGSTFISLTVTASHPGSTVQINAAPATSGIASNPLPLNPGGTSIPVVITAEDGITSKTYTVRVNVLSVSNADLADLSVSTGNIVPYFSPSSTSYSTMFLGTSSSLTITPVASNPAATITVNSSTVASGSASQPISLTGTVSPISIVVTAPDGTSTKTYTVSPSVQAAGKLTLASTLFTVVSGASVTNADIVVNRAENASGTISCLLSTSDGSATAPAHYAAQSSVSVTLTNNVNQAHVLIPIAANATTTPKFFTVNLISVSETSNLVTPTTATVIILPATAAAETVKPVVGFASPASGAVIVDTTPIIITGTATDNVGVRKVEVSINNGVSYSEATLASPGSLNTSYSIALVPGPGLNTIKARAIDFKGNVSTIVSRSIRHMHTLAVTVMGPALSGNVSSGFMPSSARQAGTTYSITATPTSGFVFNGWITNGTSGTGITPEKAELPTLSFIMQPGLVLTASFIANPFTSSIVGSYSGLITPSTTQPQPNGTDESSETVGLLHNTVVTNTGSFSGSLKMDGVVLPLAGTFDNQGVARFGTTRVQSIILKRVDQPSLHVALQIDLTGNTGKIIGTVSQIYHAQLIAQSQINADRAHYSSSFKAPTAIAGTVSKRYTISFPAQAQIPTLDSTYYPQGDGIGVMVLNSDGSLSITGKLADNTTISLSARLSRTHQWPLFQQLYTEKGCIAGVATVTDANATTEDITGTLAWFRPFQRVQWYPDGWSTGITTGIVGARYAVPSSSSVIPGLGVGLPNSTATFAQGLLRSSFMRDISIAANDVVTTGVSGYTMVTNRTTGNVTGTFPHTDGTKPTYQAIILQKGTRKGARGFFMSTSPAVIDGLGESGSVFVTGK